MGIHGLSKLIKSNTKKGYRERSLDFYINKRIAIDASTSLYQFLIAIRSEGLTLGTPDSITSHIVGMFYRTIGIVECGIKPLFVFDGVAPQEKLNELLKRKLKREETEKKLEKVKEIGDKEKMEMFEKRKVKITKAHVDDVKMVLDLLKVPYVTAPSEAEAYCAYLNKIGKVDAVASEDMDSLTFGAPLLLRNVTASKSKKLPIREFNLDDILSDLNLDQNEFIDLCILLGCDFCPSIKGVGPKTALNLINKHRKIEDIIKNENLTLPDEFCYEEARLIFTELPVGDDLQIEEIKWDEINLSEIKEFFVVKNGFNEERIEKAMERFMAARKKGKQGTLDHFFKKKQK